MELVENIFTIRLTMLSEADTSSGKVKREKAKNRI